MIQPRRDVPLSNQTELSRQIDLFRSLYSQGDAAHDFDHVLRVTALAERIALAEGADVEAVRLAALLHDVPASGHVEQSRLQHHLAAADFAREFLTAHALPTHQVEMVVHAIQAHRFRDQSIQPQTLEARCLYDGDKLDSIGAMGVGRAFAYAGAHASRLWTQPWTEIDPQGPRPIGADYTPVHEFVYKLERLQATLFTPTARNLARQRHQTMVEFFSRLDDEIVGRS